MATLPLLEYALSTAPRPLQISTSGAITVVASNPGGYSDRPELDYVAVESIVFDFGLKGSGGSDLSTADGSSWVVVAPAGWSAPAVAGQKFTFVPPPGRENVFPSAGLQFTFSQIPVNATVGTVNLKIGETASSPGDPAEPDFYPPQPRALRERTRPIGKFPVDFSVGDLTAQPPEVPVDGATVLSWSGSAGAVYEISYNGNRITKHGDGSLLQPDDSYPRATAGDGPLTLRERTTFTLTVTYTPPGGSNPAIFQRQATVSVYHPQPVISLFTATPDLVQARFGTPAAVTLSWEVKNGRKPDCVAFTVTPPLPTYPATGTGLRHEINNSQPITLTAYGAEGTTPVSQTRDVLVARVGVISDGIGKYSANVAVATDGSYAFVLSSASQSLTVIATPGTDVTTWKTVATLDGIPRNTSRIQYVSSRVGNFLLITSADFSAGALTVITVTSAAPSQWPRVTLTKGLSALAGDIAVSTDSSFVFVTCEGYNAPPSPSCVSILTLNNSNPQQWPIYNLKLSDPSLLIRYVVASPRGDVVCITALKNYHEQLWVLTLKGSDPAQWPVARAPIDGGPIGIAFSPDRTLALGADFNNRRVLVFDVAATNPAQWRGLGAITQGLGQSMFAGFTPDGLYALASGQLDNVVTVLRVSSDPPSTWKAFRLTLGIGPQPRTIVPGPKGNLTFIPNANSDYAPGSLTVVKIEPPLPAALTAVVTPAKFRPRRTAARTDPV